MTDAQREALDALITRAESLKSHALGTGWVSVADSAHQALGRALRHDARARVNPELGFERQAEGNLHDAVTFALTAYILHLESKP